MYQNAADSDGCGWSEWSLQRRPCQCVLGQASRAFSSMSIVAPNCCQRAVLHKESICIPPRVMLILLSCVCLLVSLPIQVVFQQRTPYTPGNEPTKRADVVLQCGYFEK